MQTQVNGFQTEQRQILHVCHTTVSFSGLRNSPGTAEALTNSIRWEMVILVMMMDLALQRKKTNNGDLCILTQTKAFYFK